MTTEHDVIKKYYPDITDEQVQFIIDNPCIEDLDKDDGCEYYPKCAGCTNLNGFIFARTKPIIAVSKQSERKQE